MAKSEELKVVKLEEEEEEEQEAAVLDLSISHASNSASVLPTSKQRAPSSILGLQTLSQLICCQKELYLGQLGCLQSIAMLEGTPADLTMKLQERKPVLQAA